MENLQLSTDGVDQPEQEERSTGGWIFPVLLAIVLAVAAWAGQHRSVEEPPAAADGASSVAWAPSQQPEGETVGLTVDFGNGVKKEFAKLPWRDGMTVASLLSEASEFHPGITFLRRGEGENGFLTSLDGISKQGPSSGNWQYWVNDRHGEISFCLQKIEPNDRVLWEFVVDE